VVITVSVLFAPDYVPLPGQLSFYMKILFLSLWGFATYDLLCRTEIRYVFAVYYKSVFFFSVVGIILFCLKLLGLNNSLGIYTEFYIPRLQVFAVEPQGYAGMALLCLPIWHYNANRIFKNELVSFLSLLSIGTSIILTFSPVPILLMALYVVYRVSARGLIAALMVIAVTVAAIIYNLDFFPYYYNLKFGANAIEASGTTRLDFWTVALREFLAHPLTGVGPEGYGHYYDYFKLGLRDVEVYPQPPQNLVLGILANFGAIGGLYFLTFFVGPVVALWLKKGRLDIETKTAIALWLMVMLLNMQIWNVTSQTLWFFLLLLYSRLYFLRKNGDDLQYEKISPLRTYRIRLGLTPIRFCTGLPRIRFRFLNKKTPIP